ncbi:MAG TPA: YezD family protein [Opitutaceae bacterium]|jgi:hypothetical protein|nr:YezD family protein [Opitutaceae bacterium]
MSADITAPHAHDDAEPEWLALVRSQVRSLRFGVVQLIVHDGRVTQIERTEKTRLESDPAERARRP